MEKFAGLSPRRRIHATTDLNPELNEFLSTRIRLGTDPESPPVPQITPRPVRRRRADGTSRVTNDHIVNTRRRAFDLRHQKEVIAVQKQSDHEWDETIRYRDWRAKKAMKTIEPHRVQRDEHVIESVISKRNDHFIDSMREMTPEMRNGGMAHARALPPEMREGAKVLSRTFYWG
jgi:hypothetical protein